MLWRHVSLRAAPTSVYDTSHLTSPSHTHPEHHHTYGELELSPVPREGMELCYIDTHTHTHSSHLPQRPLESRERRSRLGNEQVLRVECERAFPHHVSVTRHPVVRI